MENWKDIKYFNTYKISSYGRIKNIKTDKIKKPTLTYDGYLRITLSKNQNIKTFYTHRLVALYFLENKYNLPYVNHINGIKTNNKVSNLEWITQSENIKHAHIKGLITKRKSKILTDKKIVEIFYAEGKYKNIANHFDISPSVVSNIKRKKVYNYILDNVDDIKFNFKKMKKSELKNNKSKLKNDKIYPFKNKPIQNYENYLIDIMGNVYSLKSERYLTKQKNKNGYLYTFVSNENGKKLIPIHRLVLQTFSNNYTNLPIVNHINSNKEDNRLENLEWVSYSDNNLHMVKNNRNKNYKGEKNPMSKLTKQEVIKIYKSTEKSKILAEKYNINIRQINRIKRKERWKLVLENI